MTLWRLGVVAASRAVGSVFITAAYNTNGSANMNKFALANDTRSLLPTVANMGQDTGTSFSSNTSAFWWSNSAGVLTKFPYRTETQSTVPAITLVPSPGNAVNNNVSDGSAAYVNKAGNSAMTKYTYSTDSVSSIPATAPAAASYSDAASGSTRGYIMGGFPSPSSTTTVLKFTFSGETAANLPTGLSGGRGNGFGFASSSHGYSCGGTTGSPANVNKTATSEKFAFSDDSRSSVAALPVGDIQRGGATSSTHGYAFGGVYVNTPGDPNTRVDKHNYSANTWSRLGTGVDAASGYAWANCARQVAGMT